MNIVPASVEAQAKSFRDKLVEAVVSAGYGVVRDEPMPSPEGLELREELSRLEHQTLARKFGVCAVLSALVVIGSMGSLLPVAEAIPQGILYPILFVLTLHARTHAEREGFVKTWQSRPNGPED